MASEETLLLPEPGNVDNVHEAIHLVDSGRAVPEYTTATIRIDDGKRRAILAMVSFCGSLEFFVSGSFEPSVPQMAADLKSTPAAVSVAVGMSVLAVSIGSLCGGTYSTHYGRRLLYLWGLPLLCLGSLGVGLATSVPQLLVLRFVQMFGCAPVLSLGGAVIGDIYTLEERGQALGVFYSASAISSVIAPTIGGMITHYSSWRFMQLLIGIVGAVTYLSMYLYFPETSRPGTRGNKSEDGSASRSKLLSINPFGSLSLLRSPNILAVSVAGFFVLLTYYALLVPLVYTIAARYGITNEALVGLCFLPHGIGGMVGPPIAGRMADRAVIKWRKRNGGAWYPEDRLRATTWGTLCLAPLSVIGSGLAIKYVDGKLGLTLNMIFLFMNGVGIVVVSTPSRAYLVDILQARSAEGLALYTALRGIIMSFVIAGIFPMIEVMGVTSFDTLMGVLSLGAFGFTWLTIRYGERMRASYHVDYLTDDDD